MTDASDAARSRADYEANSPHFRRQVTVIYSAATLADLWAKLTAECATQEQHGLTVVSVSAEIVFKEETR